MNVNIKYESILSYDHELSADSRECEATGFCDSHSAAPCLPVSHPQTGAHQRHYRPGQQEWGVQEEGEIA